MSSSMLSVTFAGMLVAVPAAYAAIYGPIRDIAAWIKAQPPHA
ncbi:MAG: hypothetical protein ACHP7C_09905 [Lysobacterales bacterium]